MRKTCSKIVLLLLIPIFGMAQKIQTDSLKKALKFARTDSARFSILNSIQNYYTENNRDSAIRYVDIAISIAKKNNKVMQEAWFLDNKGYLLMHLNKYPESLGCFQRALQLAEDPENENKTWALNFAGLKHFTRHINRLDILANIHHDFGHLRGATNEVEQQIEQYLETKRLAEEAGDKDLLGFVNMNTGHVYFSLNRLDSALVMEENAQRIFNQTGDKKYLGLVYEITGSIYWKKGKKVLAIWYVRQALNTGIKQNNFAVVAYCYRDLTNYYLFEKQKDSSLYYAKKTLKTLKLMGSKALGQPYENLYQSYKLAGNTDSAYKYQGLALTAKERNFSATAKSLADFQKLSFQAQLHAQELEKEKAAIQTKIRTYVLLAGIAVLLLLAGIFYRNNRQKQKVNSVLFKQKEEIVQQKEEIETQRDNLEITLSNLKTTQTQLIQYEKMASLGELTAGIAHEIQNPLNFVNNFSEVNTELIDEMQEEIDKGDFEEVKAIANDIKENQQKINQHGKRADAIVKGMLEHSRSNSGQKEPADLNAMADEFMRLSYHGLRAKDKSFNAELITHFDPGLPKIAVVQQDIGRVMLNLFNNAFYAVNQKAKTAGPNYKPTVEIKTFAPPSGGWGAIVRDNGIGIPGAIKEKIMQPFFTTKPTGEGTGLGLSLAYDIVVKGHGGKLEVITKEGDFTEFIITLPF
jgi:two-component system NtrC family sensor kinase